MCLQKARLKLVVSPAVLSRCILRGVVELLAAEVEARHCRWEAILQTHIIAKHVSNTCVAYMFGNTIGNTMY